MAVSVQWDDPEKTIIRQIYSGDIHPNDYYEAVDQFVELAAGVNYTIHSIMDRREVISSPPNPIRALRYGNQKMPANVGLRVIVKASLLTRIMVDVGKRIAPNLVQQITYVNTLEEAYQAIEQAKKQHQDK